jgi:hypothetical protein
VGNSDQQRIINLACFPAIGKKKEKRKINQGGFKLFHISDLTVNIRNFVQVSKPPEKFYNNLCVEIV